MAECSLLSLSRQIGEVIKNQEKEELERIQEEKKSPFVHVVYGISLSLIFIVLCLIFQSQRWKREREGRKRNIVI